MPAKPTMFIGSSKEGLDIANATHSNLSRDLEVTVWKDDIFRPTKGTLENLSKALDDFDYAAFIFSGDDAAIIRDDASTVVRDNVVLEAGLFMGRLGRERVFLILPSELPEDKKLHLPTDLLGTTALYYEASREDDNWVAATNVACTSIRNEVKKYGGFKLSAGVVAYGDKVVLMAFDGSYVQVESNEQGAIKANNQGFGNWDKFEVVPAASTVRGRAVKFGDKIGLRSLKNEKFVWVDFNDDQNALGAASAELKDWERFVIRSTKLGRPAESFVTYGTSFGLLSDQKEVTKRRYVARKGDTGTFWAKAEAIGNWERLMFIEPEQ